MADILVIGMGNILMQDEGMGVRAVELLESRYLLPAGVEVIDGGTAGTELFQPMRNRERLIVADCVNTGAPPGTLLRLVDQEVPAFFQTKISNHQLGLSDLLGLLALSDSAPQHVTIIGMVPWQMENTIGLSEESRAALERMVEMLLDELRLAGVEPQLRERPGDTFWAQRSATGESSSLCA
jgi:hydrogenase maturation protease